MRECIYCQGVLTMAFSIPCFICKGTSKATCAHTRRERDRAAGLFHAFRVKRTPLWRYDRCQDAPNAVQPTHQRQEAARRLRQRGVV